MNLRTKQKKFVLWVLILNTCLLLFLAFTNWPIQAIGIALVTEIVQVIMLLRDKDPFELPKKTSRQAPYSNGFLAYALILGLTGLGLAVASFVWSSHSRGVPMVIGVTVGLMGLFLAYGGLGGWWVMYRSRRSGD